MQINTVGRRNKYSNNTITQDSEKIDIKFDLISLDLFCSYLITDTRNIRRSHLVNMKNLFDLLDMNSYINDINKMKRIDFIRRGIDARLLYNLNNKDMILKHINGGLDNGTLDIDNLKSMNSDELQWINGTISESLKYSYINNDVDNIIDVCTRFKTSDYKNKEDIVKEIETMVSNIQAKFRRSRVESISEMTFSLKDGLFEDQIKDVHDQLSNPSNKLKTGMVGFNELLSGGAESGRVYCLFGLPGEGKSTTLLNLAYQMKKANKDFKPKDPTKIPCIVFLTMENTVRETIERLFNIATINENIQNFNVEDVIKMLRGTGELYLSDNSPIDIIIKYVPGMTVDTNYIYNFIEDLEDEGYETICVIQDYLKRIKSAQSNGDIRLDLGNVVNEFKTIAAIKDIPIITASQLNRDATRNIDEGRKNNKADLLKLLGRSNIGESMLMLENLDGGFMIAPEFDAKGNKYLGIQRIKARYKLISTIDSIYHPYAEENPIKLVEDELLAQPLFKLTLRPEISDLKDTFNTGIVMSNYNVNNIKDLDKENKPILETNSNFSFKSENNNISPVNTGYIFNSIITPSPILKTVVIFNKLRQAVKF